MSVYAKTAVQLQQLIRQLAQDTAHVIVTDHAKARMAERKVTLPEVYECLRRGCIRRTPEPNVAKGSVECRMERYVAGRNLAAVAAVSDDYPGVIVVTVMEIE
ncbi:MAG: DUF4258 domain-containing protein [Pseudomonadota bacterium]